MYVFTDFLKKFFSGYPELDIMFDEKRNGRSLASVTSKESTTVKFRWICQQCHRPFYAFLTAVIKGQQCRSKGCPYCAHKRLVGGDSFAELHPDLMDEYDSDNTIDPFKVFPSDTNHANWVCRKNPAHKWEASFLARHMGYGKCPVCYHTRVAPGYTSFADHYPEIAKNWSKNNKLAPTQVFFDTRIWAQWDCPDCGCTYGAFTTDMIAGQVTCPFCEEQRAIPGVNSFAVKNPTMAAFWSRKNKRSADEVLPSVTTKAYFTCPKCHTDLLYPINHAAQMDSLTCPYCDEKKAIPGVTSLAATHPELLSRWDKNNITNPDNCHPNSSLYVSWKCPTCRGVYAASICDMVSGEASCPYCHDRKPLPGFNTFQVKHPDLMEE